MSGCNMNEIPPHWKIKKKTLPKVPSRKQISLPKSEVDPEKYDAEYPSLPVPLRSSNSKTKNKSTIKPIYVYKKSPLKNQGPKASSSNEVVLNDCNQYISSELQEASSSKSLGNSGPLEVDSEFYGEPRPKIIGPFEAECYGNYQGSDEKRKNKALRDKSKIPDKQPLGRSRVLEQRQASLPYNMQIEGMFKPVGVREDMSGSFGGGGAAVPGECSVDKSWKFLSNAPIGYQMEQLLGHQFRQFSLQDPQEDEPGSSVQDDQRQ